MLKSKIRFDKLKQLSHYPPQWKSHKTQPTHKNQYFY